MRYLIGLILSIAVIVFIIIRLLIGGGGDTTTSEAPQSLASYANSDVTVRYTIDNPVQAAQTHNDIIIDVGNAEAVLTITKGYNGEVVRTKSYPTGVEAYETFLLALDRTGNFTNGNTDPALRDERGYCANGNRYIYQIIGSDGTAIQHFWSTSCGTKTFQGDSREVERLFVNQIPDYGSLVEGVAY